MLSPADIDRVSGLWNIAPKIVSNDDPFALGAHALPFSYYLSRARQLGLSGETLIDAGCGTGRWAFAFAAMFERVIGVDKTAARLLAARSLAQSFELSCVHFVRGNILALPLPDRGAEAVFCNSVALGGMALGDIMREAFRVLRPSGACYVGLNGLGYGLKYCRHADPKMRAFGRERLYGSWRGARLGRLASEIAPGGAINAKAVRALPTARGAADFLAALGCSAAEVDGAAGIRADLGEQFDRRLIEELGAIARGEQTGFAAETAGRDYEPDEVVAAARDAGFHRISWAPDGCLARDAGGEVIEAPVERSLAFQPLYEGRPRLFEALMFRPSEE